MFNFIKPWTDTQTSTVVVVVVIIIVIILVVCLSTNGERALNYTIVKFDFNN